ncbi:hypothetical protein [Skermania piniformis]|uniref:Diacylglycerol O-acyltransferase n=1 Tax=Skermania pinensis TaxID=39122 RepID=A0ABX8S6R6_9ACTN|nr:hypothetical protein [Skermania piniformis]QXQ12867.1 hypothetical protein KV203_13175 [Skermania piniformis]
MKQRLRRAGSSSAALTRARLATGDSVNYLMSTPEHATDWVMYWVFENSVGVADVVKQVAEREPFVRALGRRVADVPRGLGNPYWVMDPTPLRERLVVRDEAVEWSSVLAAMADTFGSPLDLHEGTWRLTAFTSVAGAPVPGGAVATVVFAQVSHAILVGAQIAGLGRALFGAEPAELHIDGAGDAVERERPTASAVLGVTRLPLEVIRWHLAQGRERHALRRRTARRPMVATIREKTDLNSPRRDSELAVRVIRPDLAPAQGRGITLTALGMTAVSLAIERYLAGLGQSCPDDLAAYVPVAIAGQRGRLGVNRISAVQANLYPTITGPAARAGAIHAHLRDAREAGHDAAKLALEVGAAVPFFVYLSLLRRGRLRTSWDAGSLWATSITSVRVDGDAELALSDSPAVFGGHLVNVSTDAGLAHSFVGGTFGLTVTVTASTAALPDIDAYAVLLTQAFVDVTTAISEAPAVQSWDLGPSHRNSPARVIPAVPLSRGPG